MQAAQRCTDNKALETAKRLAFEEKLPLLIIFVLVPNYPRAQARHYWFMLEGIKDVADELEAEGLKLSCVAGDAVELLKKVYKDYDVRTFIMDKGYTRVQRQWRNELKNHFSCKCLELETEAAFRVETIYTKQAWSAAVLRRSMARQFPAFVASLDSPIHECGIPPSLNLDYEKSFDVQNLFTLDKLLSLVPNLQTKALPVKDIQGGSKSAYKKLEDFTGYKLAAYSSDKNNPALRGGSGLSPWLHYGHISTREILAYILDEDERKRIQRGEHRYLDKAGPESGLAAFIEELVVRRELAINYVWYQPAYDAYEGIPEWARETLEQHRSDTRNYLYSYEELEHAQTHDIYWNACQQELLQKGRMHGYMRMYWGKKILEWTSSPSQAFTYALELNDTWQLDGRDPNGYAGIAWCFGLHDRPWQERSIFGTVRYMNAAGLERKFPMQNYVDAYLGTGPRNF